MEENKIDLVKKVEEIMEKRKEIENLQSDKEKASEQYDYYEKLTSKRTGNEQEDLYNIRKFKDVKRNYKQITDKESVMQSTLDELEEKIKSQFKKQKEEMYKEINGKQEFIDIMEQGMKVTQKKGEQGAFDHKIPLINRRKEEIKKIEEELKVMSEDAQLIENGEYDKILEKYKKIEEKPVQQEPEQTEYEESDLEIEINAQKNEAILKYFGKEVKKNEAILDKEEVKSLYKRIDINKTIKEIIESNNIFKILNVKRKLDPSIVALLQDEDKRYLLEDYILSVESREKLEKIDRINYNLKGADKGDVIAISKYAKHAKEFAEIEGELAKGPIGRAIEGIKNVSSKLFGKIKRLPSLTKTKLLGDGTLDKENLPEDINNNIEYLAEKQKTETKKIDVNSIIHTTENKMNQYVIGKEVKDKCDQISWNYFENVKAQIKEESENAKKAIDELVHGD